MAMDWHDTLMGSVLVISAGLTFAYTKSRFEDSADPDTYRCCRHVRYRCAAVSFTLPEPLHRAPSAKRSGWLEGPRHRRTDPGGVTHVE